MVAPREPNGDATKAIHKPERKDCWYYKHARGAGCCDHVYYELFHQS